MNHSSSHDGNERRPILVSFAARLHLGWRGCREDQDFGLSELASSSVGLTSGLVIRRSISAILLLCGYEAVGELARGDRVCERGGWS